jgi:beta-galactosidase/beta-glucuronidase
VGWYWRKVRIPSAAKGMILQLRFAAVRERAEVYWNGRLVGYSLEGFTPFLVDVTAAAHYGKDNLLAVRVTNPGGGSSWMDFNPIPWGDVHLPDSHDFGGIWQDVDLLMVPPIHIQNVFAAPLEDLETVSVTTEVANAGSQARKALLTYEVYALGGSAPVVTGKAAISVPANAHAAIETKLQIPHAELWSPETPNLYRLVTRLVGKGGGYPADTCLGMRFFTEEDGRLFLNNHRVVIRSSINFGFYPYTVAYPTREFAEKEVRAAKGLGLNTLSCHRTCCTPALLDAADRLGLMIYEEPGGAPRERPPQPQSPAEAFERQAFLEKLDRLVVRDRNHPALIWWNMANEALHDQVDDPQHLNPYIDEMMRETHRLDPFEAHHGHGPSTRGRRPFRDRIVARSRTC